MRFLKTALLFILIVSTAAVASAQTGAFSFQGRLDDGATPANGSFDMQFKLFDSSVGGTQIGATVTYNTVAVVDGLFTVPLDFGSASFTAGGARWVDVAVHRTTDPPGYTTLSPRQQILSSPFSIKTVAADVLSSACVGCVTDSQINNVSGSKIVGNVATATTATTATTAGNVSGIVAVTNGGTGSATKNFVDLTTAQTIGGDKIFSNNVTVNGTLAATLGQAGTTVYSTALVTITPTTSTQTLIPGLTQTITVPAGYKVLVMAGGGAQSQATTATGIAAVDVFLTIDNTVLASGNYRRLTLPSTGGLTGAIGIWQLSSVVTLAAGSHTFQVKTVGVNFAGASDAVIGGNNTSPLQADLTVLLIKN